MIIQSPQRNELEANEAVLLDDDEYIDAGQWNRILGGCNCTVRGASYSRMLLGGGADIDVNSANMVACGDTSKICTGPNCKVVTGNECMIEVANNCDVLAGNFCNIIAKDSCVIEVGFGSKITAGSNCTLKFREHSMNSCKVYVCYTEKVGGLFKLDNGEIVKC